MKITLVKNGIFPIVRDAEGNLTKHKPDTGFPIPGTIQGEGKLAGIPVLFVRTSGCNLRCTWQTDSGEISICDTPYSSHYPVENEEWEVDDVVKTINMNSGPLRHIVISGGEPTTQPLPLVKLARKLKQQGFHITLETNGVIFIPEIVLWIDLFSLSPKLSSSEPTTAKAGKMDRPPDKSFFLDHARFRKNIDTIQKYINTCMNMGSYYGDQPDREPSRLTSKDFQLKFVIAKESDIEEIKSDFLAHLSFVQNEDILLMPLGGTHEFLSYTSLLAARLAVENGWRFTPRLQIDLFNDKQGV